MLYLGLIFSLINYLCHAKLARTGPPKEKDLNLRAKAKKFLLLAVWYREVYMVSRGVLSVQEILDN